MKNRIVASSSVLGIHDKTFSLKKDEEITVVDETDKYGRVRVVIQEQEVLIMRSMLERISN